MKLAALLSIGMAVAVSGAFGAGYLKGRAELRAAIAAQLQADRITILQDGKEIDDAVLVADDVGLCALLGGCLPVDAGSD